VHPINEESFMASKLAQQLERRCKQIVADAKQHPIYQMVSADHIDKAMARAAVRNVLLRVHLYGPHLTRAIFHAIGRIAPIDLEAARLLIELECDEAPHPRQAFEDYKKLKGNPAHENDLSVSPAAFAVAATADMLARHDSPFAFLGFLYMLESTTPVFIEGIVERLKRVDPTALTGFLTDHLEQDVKHTATLVRVIEKVAKGNPETGRAIAFGLECFSIVYPLPVWGEALAQARQETSGGS